MTTALVTGATGQDGSYLCEQLLAEGLDVHVVALEGDPALPGLLELAPGVVVHPCDLTDTAALTGLVTEVAPDEVYNFAALSSVAASWRVPVLAGAVTGLSVAAVLAASWDVQESAGRAVRVVQASSAEIFGNATQVPQDESTPIRPVNPYGAAKAYAHHMVQVFRARGLHASTVILYNHESPRRPPEFVTRKITQAAARIAAGLQDELTLGSLDVRRDWGWAPDYVRATVAALRTETADDFVVATGEVHSIEDFVARAMQRVGIDDWRAVVRTDPQFVRPAEAAMQVGDATRAREVLGWAPTRGFDGVVDAMVDHDVALVAAGGR